MPNRKPKPKLETTEMTDQAPNPFQGIAAAIKTGAEEISKSFGITEPKRVERKALVLTLAIIPAIVAAYFWGKAVKDSDVALYILLGFTAILWAQSNVSFIRGLAKDWAPAGRFFTREAQKADKS